MSDALPDPPVDLVYNNNVFMHFESAQDAWNWICKYFDLLSTLISFFDSRQYDSIPNNWNAIKQHYNQYRDSNRSDDARTKSLNHVISQSGALLGQFNGTDLPSLQRLFEISNTHSNTTAAAYLNAATKGSWRRNESHESILGYMLWYTDKNISQPQPSHQEQLDSYIQDASSRFESWFSQVSNKTKEVIEYTDKAEARLAKTRNTQKNWLRSFSEEAIQQRDSAISEGKDSLETIAQTYNNALALRAPTKYWRDRAKLHHRRAQRFGIALGITMVASFSIVATLSIILITPFEDLVIKTFIPSASAPSPVTKIAAYTATLALVYWILRILHKNLISNQHLAADAEERRVMVLTYLSLQRKDVLPPDESLDLIIASLFRPGTDGLIKEDSGPLPPLLELFLAAKK